MAGLPDSSFAGVMQRLQRAESRLDELERRVRKVWHAEPDKLEEGLIAFADGTDWDPASAGAGFVQYVGGAWVAL